MTKIDPTNKVLLNMLSRPINNNVIRNGNKTITFVKLVGFFLLVCFNTQKIKVINIKYCAKYYIEVDSLEGT